MIFSYATSAFRACKPRAPLRSWASFSSLKRRSRCFSCLSCLNVRTGAKGSEAFTPLVNTIYRDVRTKAFLINLFHYSPFTSFSKACFAVALSMTSSSTVGPVESVDLALPSATGSSSTNLVCCKMEMRVSSGMPGISFSAMALSKADGPC